MAGSPSVTCIFWYFLRSSKVFLLSFLTVFNTSSFIRSTWYILTANVCLHKICPTSYFFTDSYSLLGMMVCKKERLGDRVLFSKTVSSPAFRTHVNSLDSTSKIYPCACDTELSLLQTGLGDAKILA